MSVLAGTSVPLKPDDEQLPHFGFGRELGQQTGDEGFFAAFLRHGTAAPCSAPTPQ